MQCERGLSAVGAIWVDRSLSAKSEKTEEQTAKAPLGLRLKAWWEGYDADELARRQKGDHEPVVETPAEAEAEEPDAAPVEDKRPEMPWDEKRTEIAQFVWGRGFCGPGGPEHIVSLSKMLALTPEKSVLVLGAELGGPTRTLAKNFGAWISGYEESEELVETGNQISEAMGLAKKAGLYHYNYEKPKPFDRQFDRVFSKEALFTVRRKKELVNTIEPFIKGDGLFLVTDYVVDNATVLSSPEIRQWAKKEPKEPYLLTFHEMLEIMKNVNLSIRVNEDITEQYIKLIADSWAGADKLAEDLVARGEKGTGLIETLWNEAEFWARRSKLLENGILKVWRIVAHKKELKKMMSDW